MNQIFDVVIVGAGPGGLAALSSIQEEYSLDKLSDTQIRRASSWIRRNQKKSKRVLVVDPNEKWLQGWETNFDTLGISFLRSPAIAHCSYFDRYAFLAYAISQGRENELYESGCSDIKSLQGMILPSVGLWKLPSTKLFLDFSRDLASSLKHKYFEGKVTDIQKDSGNSNFQVWLKDANGNQYSNTIIAKSIILATGTVGKPIVPKALQNISSPCVFQWNDLNKRIENLKLENNTNHRVLVVGGGLTAVQAAQKLGAASFHVTICSRKQLVERHFDIPVKWFDEREALVHQSQFYHEPFEKRLKALKSTRGGGTIPPVYMNGIREMRNRGMLKMKVGEIISVTESCDSAISVRFSCDSNEKSTKEELQFDAIVLACGVKPDILAHPLLSRVYDEWPIEIQGGFPLVSEDLQWTENLFVVGGAASLAVGPDSANLMGIARAAETVGNALNSKTWLREKNTNVLKNPFDAFLDSDSSSTEDDDDERL